MMDFRTPDDLKIWSFDPGGTTGIAIWQDASLHFMGECKKDNFFEWLNEMAVILKPTDIVIIEDYKIIPGKASAHVWGNLDTPKLIGAIQYWAYRKGAQVIMQQPSIKPVGYGRMKKKATKGANNHAWDAVAHLVYYLMRNY